MLSAQRKVPVAALEITPKFLFGKGTILVGALVQGKLAEVAIIMNHTSIIN